MPMPDNKRTRKHLQMISEYIRYLDLMAPALDTAMQGEIHALLEEAQAANDEAPAHTGEDGVLDEVWGPVTTNLASKAVAFLDRRLGMLDPVVNRLEMSIYRNLRYQLNRLATGPVWQEEQQAAAQDLVDSALTNLSYPNSPAEMALLEEANQTVPMSDLFDLGWQAQQAHDAYRLYMEPQPNENEEIPRPKQEYQDLIFSIDDQTIALAKKLKEMEQSAESSTTMERFFSQPADNLHNAENGFAGDKGLMSAPQKVADLHGDIIRENVSQSVYYSALKELCEDLLAITAPANHDDTREFTAVKDAIRVLDEVAGPYYALNMPVDRAKLAQIGNAYKTLNTACNNYLNGKGTSRSSGYGQGRLNSVLAIRDMVCKDLFQIEDYLSRTQTGSDPVPSLDQLISGGRTTRVEVTEPDQIKTEGGHLSTRIPLQVDGETSEKKVFFTKESAVMSEQEIVAEFRQTLAATATPWAGRLNALLDRHGFEAIQYLVNGLQRAEDWAGNLEDPTQPLYGLNTMSLDQKASLVAQHSFSGSFRLLSDYYDAQFGPGSFNNDFEDMENKKALFRLAHKSRAYMAQRYIYGDNLKVDAGEEIGKRNVALSRVAGVLGIGRVVAHAEPMEIQINGEKVKGVAMDQGKGDPLDHINFVDARPYLRTGLPANLEANPLQFMTLNHMNASGQLKRDAADLQVADYIIGNFDRHLGNVTMDAGWKTTNKVLAVKGLQGIDNDACMGTVSDAQLEKRGCVMPENMVVMRRSTAEQVLRTTPEMLRFQLADLHFKDAELDAMEKRLVKLQKKIRSDMQHFQNRNDKTDLTLEQGRIRILDDQAFDNKKLTFAAIAEKVRPGKENLFKSLKGVPDTIKKSVEVHLNLKAKNMHRQEGHAVTFAPARQIVPEPPAPKGPIKKSSIPTELDSLKSVQRRLKNADHWWHRNSGDYRFMLDAVSDLIRVLERLKEKYVDETGKTDAGRLTGQEAKELDIQYRKLQNASKHYMKTHPNPGRPMGQARRAEAILLSGFRCPREIPAPVVNLNLNQAIEVIGTGNRGRSNSFHISRPKQPGPEINQSKIKDDNAPNTNKKNVNLPG